MSKRKGSVIYIRVSKDKYELPLDLDIDAEALATRWGTTANSIKSSISHQHGYWRKVYTDERGTQ